MAANYWIKLYHEILNDYKMHRLPDNLWRRTIELFLLAGDYDKEGQLPTADEIAFRLRIDPEEFSKEVVELIKVGILSDFGNGLIVTNFAKRQAPVSAAERKRYQRQRDASQSQTSHEPVTKGDIDKIRREKKEEAFFSCTFDTARQIFTELTSMVDLPASHRETGYSAIQAISHDKKTEQEVVEFLRPYYAEWKARKYSKTNLAWLTDWAVSGEIPPQKKNGDKPKTRMLKGPNFETDPTDFRMVPA